jgi:hypothetical protein
MEETITIAVLTFLQLHLPFYHPALVQFQHPLELQQQWG